MNGISQINSTQKTYFDEKNPPEAICLSPWIFPFTSIYVLMVHVALLHLLPQNILINFCQLGYEYGTQPVGDEFREQMYVGRQRYNITGKQDVLEQLSSTVGWFIVPKFSSNEGL